MSNEPEFGGPVSPEPAAPPPLVGTTLAGCEMHRYTKTARVVDTPPPTDALAELLAFARDMRSRFIHQTHPGRPCMQSGHIPVEVLEEWDAGITRAIEAVRAGVRRG